MMLSLIGRRSMMRISAHNTNAANRTFLPIFILHSISGFYDKNTSITIFSVSSASKTYATAVKKRPGAKKASITSKKTKKSVKPSRIALKKTRNTAKKPRSAAKKSKKVIKKKVNAKPKRVIKPLTEAQKQSRRLIDLKRKALKTPDKLPSTARCLYMAEHLRGTPGSNIISALTEFSVKWKSISQSELERYEEKAKINRAANEALFNSWLTKFTPDEIRIANNARRQITKLTPRKLWKAIPDTRLPKRPLTAFMTYLQERRNSGEFSGVSVIEATKKMALDYKALPPAQRKKYEDIHSQNRDKYIKDFKSAYHRDSSAVTGKATN